MSETVPLSGTTLVLGPSNVGKTRLTALTLERWVEERGAEGVVVFDFAPEFVRDGALLGGRLDRFTTPPPGVWRGGLDAHAPRAETDGPDEATALARTNAENAARLFERVPRPRALFVNDATIPFQHPSADPGALTALCESAECAVLNAFESDELGTDDPVSRAEAAVLDALRAVADRVVRLEEGGGEFGGVEG